MEYKVGYKRKSGKKTWMKEEGMGKMSDVIRYSNLEMRRKEGII